RGVGLALRLGRVVLAARPETALGPAVIRQVVVPLTPPAAGLVAVRAAAEAALATPVVGVAILPEACVLVALVAEPVVVAPAAPLAELVVGRRGRAQLLEQPADA